MQKKSRIFDINDDIDLKIFQSINLHQDLRQKANKELVKQIIQTSEKICLTGKKKSQNKYFLSCWKFIAKNISGTFGEIFFEAFTKFIQRIQI